MLESNPKLYLEINNSNFTFYVIENNENDQTKILFKLDIFLEEFEKNKILDLEKVFNTIKKNIYLIEQKLSCTFKELILILENFQTSFANLTGFKKLNGSQILRENITYILNTLKSSIDETERKKTILHIFNSKFDLDKRKIDNVPIGLFGDFYSHELSFVLINTNDLKNLKSIFDKCNLKIKKILIKSFIKGANIINAYNNLESFSYVKISNDSSKIFYFENNSLKFEQDFKFGAEIVLKDISKVTSIKLEDIKIILNKIELSENLRNDEFIEKEIINESSFIKIKKKLIYEIALARIKEMSELIIFKNINLKHDEEYSKKIFLEIDSQSYLKGLKRIYKSVFSNNGKLDLNLIECLSSKNLLETANKLVHYGWKKEAIPITQPKKSIIKRFFEAVFG